MWCGSIRRDHRWRTSETRRTKNNGESKEWMKAAKRIIGFPMMLSLPRLPVLYYVWHYGQSVVTSTECQSRHAGMSRYDGCSSQGIR